MTDLSRGYFGIGVERTSKPANLGSLMRTAHAFDASFFFTVNLQCSISDTAASDTSDMSGHVPLYHYPDVNAMQIPRGCRLVGVELLDDAVDLPSFRHPMQAAYVFGPERDSLSPAMLEKCDALVRIPSRFCVNVSTAGAIVMYDRMISLGRFPRRPVSFGGPSEPMKKSAFGSPIFRNRR